MKISKTSWFYIVAAAITIYGVVTGSFLLIFLAFPIGLFGLSAKDKR